MKLRDGFILHDVCGKQVAVAAGAVADVMRGMVRSNETATFIFNHLMKETTEESIVDAMLAEYDAPREVIEKDVHSVVEQLRNEGLIED